ncbi:pyridoxal-dependent decarboxylase [Ascidiimonas aurantiaca]|uniref:pyridoxal-dependent decarboxylase n=1 Tax=Ascidiimonas aurantiaca TaxID=1685432 RepID=UPI0030EE7BF4
MKITKEAYHEELNSFLSYLNNEKSKCLGIQINQDADDCLDFAPFLKHTLNNLGDPFSGKGGHLETFKYERELVSLMAGLLHLSPQNSWGYYTGGSSVSNLQAVHLGVKKLSQDVTLVTSVGAHNSICKAGAITRVKAFKEIETTENGDIDTNAFSHFLESRNNNEKFIFCFCSGTVAKGAYDNVPELIRILKEKGIKADNCFIHLDAALGGMITPFLENTPLKLDFSIPEIDSLSVSFHKRLGIPVPGSLFLLRKSSFDFSQSAPFIEDYKSHDTTVPGSRDGLSPFITLMKLKKIGYEGMADRTEKVLKKATSFANRLQEEGIKVIKNPYSPCVYFEAPDDNILKEYHLPLYLHKDGFRYTHIFTMEHVTEEALEVFLSRMLSSRLAMLHKSAG